MHAVAPDEDAVPDGHETHPSMASVRYVPSGQGEQVPSAPRNRMVPAAQARHESPTPSEIMLAGQGLQSSSPPDAIEFGGQFEQASPVRETLFAGHATHWERCETFESNECVPAGQPTQPSAFATEYVFPGHGMQRWLSEDLVPAGQTLHSSPALETLFGAHCLQSAKAFAPVSFDSKPAGQGRGSLSLPVQKWFSGQGTQSAASAAAYVPGAQSLESHFPPAAD